jgi:hypothetical protein
LQEGGGLVEARVGVDFDQPGVALPVEHEVIAEDLETVATFLLVDLPPDAEHAHPHDLLYSAHEILEVLALLVEQSPQDFETQLIALLVPAIVLVVFLNRVVGEMHVEISHFI